MEFFGTLIVLVIAISHTSTLDDYYGDGDDYSEEDVDYETYFDKYDPGKYIDWGGQSSETVRRGPLNQKGEVRTDFATNQAFAAMDRSIVCSPVSVLLSIGKLALGAEGRCLYQLLDSIGLKNKKQLKRAFKPIIDGLKNVKGVRLHLISKIYVSKEVRLKSQFRKRARKIFKSSVVALDFNKPAASARTINEWVKKQTRHGIQNIISERDISTKPSLVLINAVYFAGFWERKFEKVTESTFYTARYNRKISMMTRYGNYKYGSSARLDSQLVEIPYEGGKTSLFIVLPNSKDGLPVLLEKMQLAPTMLQEGLKRMFPTDIILSIPKFRTEVQINLKAALAQVHVTDIFDSNDSGLDQIVKGGENIHLSKAVHRAVIVVNELGTKAASSSGLDLINTASTNLNRKIFHANHPFFYFVLFEGEQILTGTLV